MTLKPLVKISLAVLCSVLLSACGSLHQQGTESILAGNYKLAERQLTAAIESGDPSAWNNLGVIYERTGRSELAKRAFHMAARYGDGYGKQALINKGLPVPDADLQRAAVAKAAQEKPASEKAANSGLSLALDVLSAYGAARSQSAGSNTLQSERLGTDQPATSRMMPPVPPSTFRICNSTVVGQSISTTCY